MENQAEIKKLRKEARELRKSLRQLSDAVLLSLHFLDKVAVKDKFIQSEVGEKIAKTANWLELQNDSVRRYALDLGIDEVSKEAAVKKLIGTKK